MVINCTNTVQPHHKTCGIEFTPISRVLDRRHVLDLFPLQRGKFRPRLQQLVASNSEDTVEKCSRKAFSLLPDVKAAIAELSALKGVGPATASGERDVTAEANRSKLDTPVQRACR